MVCPVWTPKLHCFMRFSRYTESTKLILVVSLEEKKEEVDIALTAKDICAPHPPPQKKLTPHSPTTIKVNRVSQQLIKELFKCQNLQACSLANINRHWQLCTWANGAELKLSISPFCTKRGSLILLKYKLKLIHNSFNWLSATIVQCSELGFSSFFHPFSSTSLCCILFLEIAIIASLKRTNPRRQRAAAMFAREYRFYFYFIFKSCTQHY